jgi:DNA-binding IclR family transcriptional regulator
MTPSGGVPSEPGTDREFVSALARGLKILQAFQSAEERLSNADLAQRCGLPRSTIARLTHTLTATGFLHQEENLGRYRLGLATLTLGRSMLSKLDFQDPSGELLQKLANDTGAMVALGIREELSVLYIDARRSQSTPVTLNLGIGARLPLATTAMGKAHLAAMGEAERCAVLARIKALDPAAWPKVEEGVRQAIVDMQQHGCVTAFQSWRGEINGIATPLDLGSDVARVVINVAAPAKTIDKSRFLAEIRPRLIAAKQRIEASYRSGKTSSLSRNGIRTAQ